MKQEDPVYTEQNELTVADTASRFWSMESHDIIRELSHWDGTGVFGQDGVWESIGRRHFSFYEELCGLVGRERSLRRMLEWGPGGGANAVAFADEVETFIGVDISAPNLEECIRQMDRVGFIAEKEFVPVLFDISFPESVRGMVREPVDFILSTAVFQHFPSKTYGERVTRTIYDLLAPGGIALIQTRVDDGSQSRRPKSEGDNYVQNYASFTTYGPGEYRDVAERIGFEIVRTRFDERLSYLYNFMVKR